MNINFYKLFLLFFCVCFWVSCDEPEDSSNNNNDNDSNQNESTLDQDSVGDNTANLQDMLFYNFESDIDYSYDYYSVDGIGYGNTISLPCSIRPTDVVDFYTFPEFLIEAYNCSDESIICGDSDVDYDDYINNTLLDETYGGLCSCQCLDDEGFAVDCGDNDAVSRSYSEPAAPQGGACQNPSDSVDLNEDGVVSPLECTSSGWIWFDSVIDCSIMDANQDCIMSPAQETDLINAQSVDFSVSYTNLEKLSWDVEAIRYKPQVSSDQTLEQTVTNEDDPDYYDVSTYWTIINEWEDIDGMVYIDHAQWNDTTLIYEEQPANEDEDVDIILDHTFNYTRSIINTDSLMFRINSDCNNDGQWTAAEEYADIGKDGCPSIYEDGENGCVCIYNIDSELNECTIEDAICDPDSDNELLCADGTDANLDNYQDGYDSLIYTEGNEQYDEGESFIDRPDGLIAAEVFWDVPVGDTEEGNGVKDGLEPWQDLNCNNIYDDDISGGNGIWDDDEFFQDIDQNGEWNDNEPLYRTSSSPNQIIVNYDTNGDGEVNFPDEEPQVINEIDPDEINQAMVYLNGGYQFYDNIIQEIEESDYQYYKYTPIERIETIYSNELIEDIPSDLMSSEYYIAKTYWETLPDGTDTDNDGVPDRFYDYDYHLFKYSDDGLTKLVHPSYFYHYGYFETPDEIEDGFYEVSDLIQDIMIYTVNGDLREGERVTSFESITVDSNNDGVDDMQYEVSKEFEVDYEYIDVPMRKVLGEIVESDDPLYNCSQGQMLRCFSGDLTSCIDESNSNWAENECGEKLDEINECPADTTIAAYKITRTKNILMIGNGVEFGERNTVWLADPNQSDSNQIGIVMDKLEHRWTEDYWSEEDALDWKEFSRLELTSTLQNGETNLLGRLLNNNKIIELNDFENENSLNNDPYIPKPTGIIQRVRLPHE